MPDLPYKQRIPGIAANDPLADIPWRVFEAHNQARVSGYTTVNGTYGGGLSALEWDDRAGAVARRRAQVEYERQAGLSHDPDGDGVLDVVEVWVQMYGRQPLLGENLAKISPRSNVVEQVMTLWLASPTHQENIFYGFKGMGVGHFGDYNEAHYLAVCFVG